MINDLIGLGFNSGCMIGFVLPDCFFRENNSFGGFFEYFCHKQGDKLKEMILHDDVFKNVKIFEQACLTILKALLLTYFR